MGVGVADIGAALMAAAETQALKSQLNKLGCGINLAAGNERLWQYVGLDGGDVRIKAPMQTWSEVFEPIPKPGFQSLGALYRLRNEVLITAETKLFMQALPTLESLIEQAREILHPKPANQPIRDDLSRLSGRYINTDSGTLYVEESGNANGDVICMLHTAGADGRQWHGLMTHDELQPWRMLAFDMPNHGRSPVTNDKFQWQWELDESTYVKTVCDFIKSVTDKPVILMGCSMGAAIGLALLAQHPDLFKAAILFETPYSSPGRRTPYLNHPQVHGGRLAATWVASLLSPNSPAPRRNLARWIYSQSGPGVYDGDLRFYSDEFHASRHTPHIDTSKTPIWLLTGDYDYSASPADTRRVANEIPGAHFIEMHGFGHFPMTEDPQRLVDDYLRSILKMLGAL